MDDFFHGQLDPILGHLRETDASQLPHGSEVECCQRLKRCFVGLSAVACEDHPQKADLLPLPVFQGGQAEFVEEGSLLGRRGREHF